MRVEEGDCKSRLKPLLSRQLSPSFESPPVHVALTLRDASAAKSHEPLRVTAGLLPSSSLDTGAAQLAFFIFCRRWQLFLD